MRKVKEVKLKKANRSFRLFSDKAARRKARREARNTRKIKEKEALTNPIKEAPVKEVKKKVVVEPRKDVIPGKTQGEKCIACGGSGRSSKKGDCYPCRNTGFKRDKRTPHEALCPDRKRLKCDRCNEIREALSMTNEGLLCLTCIREMAMDKQSTEESKTNSAKRKEKLGDSINVNDLAGYLSLGKKQKLAFIGECTNLKLLPEIQEHERQHSKKRHKRATKRIRVLTN